MILAVAWRNIWRNRLRSSVIIVAIAIGIFAGVFTWSFYRGMMEQRVQTAIITESSHIQIHQKNYLSEPDQKHFLGNSDSIIKKIERIPAVKAVSRRVLVNAMISSTETGSGVKIFGIDTTAETAVTNIYSKIKEGTYLRGKKTPIVIGEKLAEKLSVKIRSRVVITLQTMDGTLTSGLFRVAGIYKTSNSMYDESNAFVKRDDIINLLGLDSNSCHEMAILLQNNDQLNTAAARIKSELPFADVSTWRELMPEVSLVDEMMDVYMYFFMVVILGALIFGIINTMLMAVLERVKELGMLMAVGMSRARVFFMILLETVLLSLTGGLGGIIIAHGIILFTSHRGIDLSLFAEGIEKLGYESMVYPVTDLDINLKVAFMVLITGILAAVYPAWKAIQLKPADALHLDN